MYKCNKVAIAEMVAKLDSLEREYSPHIVSIQPACSLPEVEQGISLDPVEQADVSGPEQEGESAIGSLHLQMDGGRGLHHGDVVCCPSPYPVVDWAAVRFKPSLPHPKPFPVYGVSTDLDVYNSNKFTSPWPFGRLPGYNTSQGVVSVPRVPVQGYLYDVKLEAWVLAARPARWLRGCAAKVSLAGLQHAKEDGA